MTGPKHREAKGEEAAAPPASPFMSMFETFRSELDEHHDRRERIIKASRDITALSKKMIFSLQRVRTLRTPLPPTITKENYSRQSLIIDTFVTIVSDLQGINAWRYQRQISPGIQEYVEAISFQHYLRHQTLITFAQAQHQLPPGISLVEDDYLLGLFDLVGELMRFAITSMATHGSLPRGPKPSSEQDSGGDGGGGGCQEEEENEEGRDILTDLQSLRSSFESLDTTSSGKDWTPLKRDVGKKLEVMRNCVEKVEGAMYGMIVRGRERPKGWVPDLGGGEAQGREVESY